MAGRISYQAFHIDERILGRLEREPDYDYAYAIYEAEGVEVVLGRSSKIEEDVYEERCRADRVPISRRSGGGGTVVLSPGVIIVSVAGTSGMSYHLREHMLAVNERIIETLEGFGVPGLAAAGTSDIAIGGRKILGSSLHRSRDLILYQGSLLVDPDLELMNRYLKQPVKQPAYRHGRRHDEFVTSLHREGHTIPLKKLTASLVGAFDTGSPWPPDI
jgi:lipoate-protein ligase A